jgi:[acyl-carrier-protein] S-malonyltransferase
LNLGLLFPGQGSQHVGMGRELASAFPEAAAIFEQADDVLGFSLTALMWGGDADELTQTRNAQPAILVHSVAAHAVMAGQLSNVLLGAGHSLGEFSAHVAGGTLSFEDALRAVRLRGELMFASGGERPGTMAAVLGLDDEAVGEVCLACSEGDSVVVPANFNSAGQVVVSGDVAAVERAMGALKEAGARRVLPLNVSGAFHSPLMKSAEDGLRSGLEATTFIAPTFPVVSNVTARPTENGEEARDLLVRQLTSPVRWTESIACMVQEGVESFVELGPGSVLAGLNRRNAKGFATVSLGTPENIESWENA